MDTTLTREQQASVAQLAALANLDEQQVADALTPLAQYVSDNAETISEAAEKVDGGALRRKAEATARRDAARAVAIQAVAELGRGVTILDREVADGASRRELLKSLRLMRHVLRTLEDAAVRDGRPA